jgi:hypothetical protein
MIIKTYLKNRACQKLVDFCKTAVWPDANKDCCKNIQGIRGSFRKELKKTNETKRSGSSEEDMHKPNLLYFEFLLFTRDQE